MALRALSLCAGIGGIDLGLRGIARTICYVEREAFCAAILRTRMLYGSIDDAPIWTNLCTFDARPWRGAVDLVTAGFPCQPFSTASRGRVVAQDLWPWVRRVVSECEPGLVFLENVQRAPIERAAIELENLGYTAAFDPYDCAELGAPHCRFRWWLLAYTDDAKQSALALNAQMAGLPKTPQIAEWKTRPDRILGMDPGVPYRMDRLRSLGNSVVPAVARWAFLDLLNRNS